MFTIFGRVYAEERTIDALFTKTKGVKLMAKEQNLSCVLLVVICGLVQLNHPCRDPPTDRFQLAPRLQEVD